MTKEQAKAGRLSFDDEGNQMVKGAGMKPGGTAGKYIATQAVISGMKAVTSERKKQMKMQVWKVPDLQSVKQKLRYVAYVMLRSAANERM